MSREGTRGLRNDRLDPKGLPRPLGSVRTILPFALLLLLFALLVSSVRLKSPTADEQNHLARGLAYLKTGDLRLSQEHPPGVNVWSAWPLLLDPDIRLPLESQSWADAEWYGFADQLLWRVNTHLRTNAGPQTMIFASRVPVMWLTLVLSALVYRWARELGGPWAGLFALGLAALDPNLLAHGRLTTTDAGLACTALAAMYALWHAQRQGGWRRWVAAGIALGAALLSKFSALVLVPLVLIVVLFADPKGLGKPLGSLVIAALVVWAGYAFTWGPIAAVNGFPGPAPAYWAGVRSILRRTGAGSPAFLLGQVSTRGWWTYFPVAFAVKTPLPTLIALAVALGVWGMGKLGIGAPAADRMGDWGMGRTGRPNFLLSLLLPPLAFWALAIAGGFNIGYRHVLPSWPFLHILSGVGIRRWVHRPQVGRRPYFPVPHLLLVILYTWLAIETLSIAPHYLAYFNQLAGGPGRGYRVLVDSNLDWGQDLPGLVRYVEREGIERVNLSWFGAAHPEAYDLAFHPLPGFWRFGGEAVAYGFNPYAPAAGVYAISATNLPGVKLADRDTYAWFREREPDAHVGHSILIYQVPAGKTNASGAAVLGVPLARLAKEEREILQRVDSVRRYDPQTGIIIPADTREISYITTKLPGWGDVVREGPEYVVVRGPSPVPPAVAPGKQASFGGFVVPLDHDVSELEEGTLTVTVRWHVERPPHHAAVSFAHLLDAGGRYVAGWDGLTAPATCWQAGDWIEQHYALSLPPNLQPGTYQIEVGWYDADTGQRWPYIVKGETVGDRMVEPWKMEDRKGE